MAVELTASAKRKLPAAKKLKERQAREKARKAKASTPKAKKAVAKARTKGSNTDKKLSALEQAKKANRRNR